MFPNSVFLRSPCEILFGFTGPIFTKLPLASLLHCKGKANTRLSTPWLVSLGEMQMLGSPRVPPAQISRWVLGGCLISKLPGRSPSQLDPRLQTGLRNARRYPYPGYSGISRKKKRCQFIFHSVKNTNRSNISSLSSGNMVLGLLTRLTLHFKPAVLLYFPLHPRPACPGAAGEECLLVQSVGQAGQP